MAKKQTSRRSFVRDLAYLSVAAALGVGTYVATRTPDVTPSQLEHIAKVGKVLANSNSTPDVIYIPFIHPSENFSVADREIRNASQIEAICTQLYKEYGVKSLLLEGIDEKSVATYNKRGLATLGSSNTSKGGREDDYIMSVMLSTKKWNLLPGESEELISEAFRVAKPAREITQTYGQYVQLRGVQLNQDIALNPANKENLIHNAKIEIDFHRSMAQSQINNFFTPEKLEQVYNISVVERNKKVAQRVVECKRQGKGPVIVLYGSLHLAGLVEEFTKNNLKYAVVCTNNFDPTNNDKAVNLRESLKATYNIPPAIIHSN